MKTMLLLSFVLFLSLACSKNETPSSQSNFDPLVPQKEDPLKLGTGACTVEKKEDCDTAKK